MCRGRHEGFRHPVPEETLVEVPRPSGSPEPIPPARDSFGESMVDSAELIDPKFRYNEEMREIHRVS